MITKPVQTFIDKGYALTDMDKLKGAVKSSLVRLHKYDDKDSIQALYANYEKVYGVDNGYKMVDKEVKKYYSVKSTN